MLSYVTVRVSREQRSAPGSLRSVSSVGSAVSSVIAVDGAVPTAAHTTTTTTKSRPNSSQSPNLPEDPCPAEVSIRGEIFWPECEYNLY